VSSGFVISHVFQETGQFGIGVNVSDGAGGLGTDALVADVKDAVAPVASPAQFLYESGPQRITISFSQDVSASLLGDATDLTVHNLDDNTDLPAVTPTWDTATMTATWTFASLPNGNFRATLHKAGVTDAAGIPLATDAMLDFWFLNGDANRDRSVDFNDLVALAQNYNTTGKTFAQGDFTGDGSVDFNDLVVLAQHYNTTVPPAAPRETAQAVPIAGAAPMPSLATVVGQLNAPAKPAPHPVSRPAPKAKHALVAAPANVFGMNRILTPKKRSDLFE
jgi:hypothetical protein